MPFHCYVIYSAYLDKYYIGVTEDFTNRIEMHNSGFSPYTSKAKDWTLRISIPCKEKSIALKLERHIKSMKSRSYIENLIRHPEVVSRLLGRFSP
jgi:putative endonuclease